LVTRAEPHAFLVVGGKGREIQAVDLDDAFVRPTPAVALASRKIPTSPEAGRRSSI
jgi:hypothetical protein